MDQKKVRFRYRLKIVSHLSLYVSWGIKQFYIPFTAVDFGFPKYGNDTRHAGYREDFFKVSRKQIKFSDFGCCALALQIVKNWQMVSIITVTFFTFSGSGSWNRTLRNWRESVRGIQAPFIFSICLCIQQLDKNKICFKKFLRPKPFWEGKINNWKLEGICDPCKKYLAYRDRG